MAINLNNVKAITHNNKDVIKIEDSNGNIIWEKEQLELIIPCRFAVSSSSYATSTGTLEPGTINIDQDGTSMPFTKTVYFIPYYLWSDGDYWYIDSSSNSVHYKFDLVNESVTSNTWNVSNNNIEGDKIWTDGTDIYCSNGNGSTYLFDKTNKTWSSINFGSGDVSTIYGQYVWSDGTDVYYGYSGTNYTFHKSDRSWHNDGAPSFSSFDGRYVWTDGTEIYYDNGYDKKKLDNGSWTNRTGATTSYLVKWTDGVYVYASSNASYTYADAASQWPWRGEASGWENGTATQFKMATLNAFPQLYLSTNPDKLYTLVGGHHTTFKLCMFEQ